jgi:hypothetical protein
MRMTKIFWASPARQGARAALLSLRDRAAR